MKLGDRVTLNVPADHQFFGVVGTVIRVYSTRKGNNRAIVLFREQPLIKTNVAFDDLVDEDTCSHGLFIGMCSECLKDGA